MGQRYTFISAKDTSFVLKKNKNIVNSTKSRIFALAVCKEHFSAK